MLRQVKFAVVNFAVGNFAEPHELSGSCPQCVLLVCEKFAENPEFRVGNSIAFGKSTSQRIYREQHTPKIGWKLHKITG